MECYNIIRTFWMSQGTCMHICVATIEAHYLQRGYLEISFISNANNFSLDML